MDVGICYLYEWKFVVEAIRPKQASETHVDVNMHAHCTYRWTTYAPAQKFSGTGSPNLGSILAPGKDSGFVPSEQWAKN